jgi:hypothetical protein
MFDDVMILASTVRKLLKIFLMLKPQAEYHPPIKHKQSIIKQSHKNMLFYVLTFSALETGAGTWLVSKNFHLRF